MGSDRKTLMAIDFGIRQGLQELGDVVPDGECVYSIKPSIVGLFTHRVARLPPAEEASDASFLEGINAGGCRYVFAIAYVSPTYATPYYPLERLADAAMVVRELRVPVQPGTASVIARIN